MDRREELALLPLADNEAVRLLAEVPEDARAECWWLVRRDGTLVPGNLGGGVELLIAMRLSRPLGCLARAGRLSSLVDALDTFLSGYRKPLGRFVPEGRGPRRYP